jgi:hypothetical protein
MVTERNFAGSDWALVLPSAGSMSVRKKEHAGSHPLQSPSIRRPDLRGRDGRTGAAFPAAVAVLSSPHAVAKATYQRQPAAVRRSPRHGARRVRSFARRHRGAPSRLCFNPPRNTTTQTRGLYVKIGINMFTQTSESDRDYYPI